MRYLIVVVCSFLSIALSAQYERGTWYLDAGSGIGNDPGTEAFGSTIRARIKGGYFLRDGLLLGSEIHVNRFDGQGFSDSDGASLFARYYLPNRNNSRLRYFGEAALSVDFDERFSPDITFGIGAEYALAPNILLTANLSGGFGGQRGLVTDLRIGTNYTFGSSTDPFATPNYTHQKGDLMLDANFGSLSTNGRFYLAGDLNLAGGYFLSENLLVTGELGFYRASFDLGIQQAERKLDLTEYSAATGLRYQFNNGRRFQPYLAAGLRYGYVSDKRNGWTAGPVGRTGTFTESNLRADLKAGFLHHLDPNIALDFNLQYQPVLSGSDATGSNGLGAQLGLKLFLGKR